MLLLSINSIRVLPDNSSVKIVALIPFIEKELRLIVTILMFFVWQMQISVISQYVLLMALG